MATEGKRTYEETESKQKSPKRIKLQEEPDDSINKQVTSQEDDEEFTVESDSDSEQRQSDSEEYFSDDVEEEDDDDGGINTTIVSGVQGECKKSVEGKYSLHHVANGRGIKIIIDESHIKEAIAASADQAKKNFIPVFQVTGLDVSKNDSEELIVYAQQLSLLAEEYHKSDDSEEQKEADVKLIQGSLLKIENMDETFITTDFMENEV